MKSSMGSGSGGLDRLPWRKKLGLLLFSSLLMILSKLSVPTLVTSGMGVLSVKGGIDSFSGRSEKGILVSRIGLMFPMVPATGMLRGLKSV